MADNTEKLQERLAREQAQLAKDKARTNKRARKIQGIAARLGKKSRDFDTHLKCIYGAWAEYKAGSSEDFNAMFLRDMDSFWMVLDEDRLALGLEPLPPEERERRLKASAARATETKRQRANGDTPGPIAALVVNNPEPAEQTHGGELADNPPAREAEPA